MADDVLDYSLPGPFTSLDPSQLRLAEGLPDDPVGICAAAQGLVIHIFDVGPLNLPEDRLAEKDIRPVNALITALTALDPSPLHQARPPGRRVVGTCRDFVTIACALLRLRGIPARARCGFGMYFKEGYGLDHWITEYWRDDEDRWVRVDTEHLGHGFVARPDDLAEGEFLTGGEAWTRYRQGHVDGHRFGVPGTDDAWGPSEIRGNAVRDLAALCKHEMLPWDEWGRMTDAYAGKTGPDYDLLLDTLADTCADAHLPALFHLSTHPDLAVPAHLLA
ncbi:transglutaminase-like domain-containing protein [Microbispora sp. ATCC PTA-5024]|uniref:transglutaminase-like domain-containing protein n=1 Tax=Microbispora sp. ATCC PTA-5024 TaxID=316330 RepID=UPI0003DC916F|nr:transglutaminase-like domain-containing protein [Microbispora sp. ATCC PTA-5024]ETK31632.1 transglutaminase [Microbispora sp. ATCC PTA-5024]